MIVHYRAEQLLDHTATGGVEMLHTSDFSGLIHALCVKHTALLRTLCELMWPVNTITHLNLRPSTAIILFTVHGDNDTGKLHFARCSLNMLLACEINPAGIEGIHVPASERWARRNAVQKSSISEILPTD